MIKRFSQADRSAHSRVSIESLETRTLCSATAVTSAAAPLVRSSFVTAADVPAPVLTGPTNQSVKVGFSKGFRVGTFTSTDGGPFTVNITWGDGHTSHNKINSVGGIPLGVHIYTKAGKYTVTENITDSLGGVSNTVSYLMTVIAPATISGRVYIDANRNGKLDAGEAGLKARVFFDNNNNGKLDTLENWADLSDGKFSLSGLDPGTYYIRIIPPSGYVATNPTTNVRKITVVAGQVSLGNNYGERKK